MIDGPKGRKGWVCVSMCGVEDGSNNHFKSLNEVRNFQLNYSN